MPSSTTAARRRTRPAGVPSPVAMFFQGFLKHPVMVGSIIPSSDKLIRKMLKPVDWSACKLFVEYGPGVGTFCRPILERMAARGVRVLLPVLGSGLQRDWAEYAGADDLQQRSPGRPPEPGGEPLGPAALADADVIIVPALAVDTSGARLGQGGGWYDRALEHARDDVLVIALTFPEEVYEAGTRPLPHEPHDRHVDAVATPEGWQRLRRRDAA